MHIGFIGTGVITSAIVTGVCTSQLPVESIWVSPRNKEKSRILEQKFKQVNVGDSNQAVIDHSDVVVLGILPQQMEKILSDLKFRPDQTVVNLLAGITISEVIAQIDPVKQVVRAVPLPCVAIHKGPIAMFPHDEEVSQLFEALGSNIVVDNEQQLESLSIITALMAPYYAMLETIVRWAVNQGISQKNASDYTASMFEALSLIAEEAKEGDLDILIKDSMTPGGLNELAMATIEQNGGFENMIKALEQVKKKVA